MTRNVESIFGAVVTAPHQIPYTYTATGGEKFISLPFYPVTGIVTINGGMQVPLDNFEIDGNTLNLGSALSKGDVVFCLFDKILSPEDYKTGIRIYKFQAMGGETEFTPDYTSYGVQSLYIGGEYKIPEIEYSYDSTTGKVSLQTALTAGVWVVAEMSVKQPNISPLFDRSIQEIARAANVKDSEVILSTDTTQVLNGKKVVYDVVAQRIYGLPTLPTNVYINSVSNGQLTYSPGNITVTLLDSYQQQNTRELWRRSLAEAGLTLVDGSFEEGATANSKTDAVWYVAGGQCYTWDGAFPKTVAAGSTPATSGVGVGAWLAVGDATLRTELASAVGAAMVGLSQGDTVQTAFDKISAGTYSLGYRSSTIKDRLDVMLTTSAMGAVGDGSTDDTAAVQLAIDTLSTLTRKATLYIDGRCKVSSLTIPATLSLHMVGNNVGGASYSRSALICSNATGPAITCNGSACTFEDIQFVGASNDTAGGGDTTQTAILFAPGVANSYNCDGLVKGCGFIFFNKIVDLRGRNLKLVDNIFSNSAFGVWIGATGIPDFRALDIQGCRFHYMSAAAGNETTPTAACAVYVAPNTNFFNINITGNLSDGGKWFFVGAAAWGVINNNHFNAQQTGVLYHYNTGMTLGTLFHRTSFSNNVVTHTFVTSPNGQTDTVYLVAGWGVDVLNNTINNAHRRAINNGVPNTRIAGNTLIEAGFITGGFPVIESTGANTSIINNTLVRYGTVASVPSVGIKASNFTSVEGNRFPLGFGASGVPEWDTSSRGDTLIYGVMDIAALPSEEWGTAAPTSGRYLRGSKVWNTNVPAGGTLGWVCVASGTPGTWKGFGGVAP